MRRLACIGLSVSSMLWLGGCASGNDYVRPAIELPPKYQAAQLDTSHSAVKGTWWTQFGDPMLVKLVGEAVEANLDVRQAALRVIEYQHLLRATEAMARPQVGVSANAAGTNAASSFQVGLSVSWEVDFFGRLQRMKEAAAADLMSQEYGRQAVLLGVVSGVASSYLQLREYDARLALIRLTVQGREEQLRVARLRQEAGLTSQLEVSQRKGELESTLLSQQQLELQISTKQTEIGILLGKPYGMDQRGLGIDQLRAPLVPAGVPAELLQRRPDVMQAEQVLVSANAQRGVARANLMPRITLSPNIATTATQLAGLFAGAAQSWSIGAGLSGTAYSGGSLQAQVRASDARSDQAFIAYQKAVISAVREVEDALTTLDKSTQILASQRKLVSDAREYVRVARLRYENGMSSNLEVIDSQRNLFAAEQAEIQTLSNTLQAAIALYKATGGAWEGTPRPQ